MAGILAAVVEENLDFPLKLCCHSFAVSFHEEHWIDLHSMVGRNCWCFEKYCNLAAAVELEEVVVEFDTSSFEEGCHVPDWFECSEVVAVVKLKILWAQEMISPVSLHLTINWVCSSKFWKDADVDEVGTSE